VTSPAACFAKAGIVRYSTCSSVCLCQQVK